jgi:hypothetical protein
MTAWHAPSPHRRGPRDRAQPGATAADNERMVNPPDSIPRHHHRRHASAARALALVALAGCGRRAPEPAVPPTPPMVAIPAGTFPGAELHRAPGSTLDRYDHAEPPYRAPVWVAAFEIDRDVVSCHDYALCQRAEVCPDPLADASGTVPIVGHETCHGGVIEATWPSAQRYCAWRSARLPSFVEWQRAARGTDGRLVPPGFDRARGDLQPYTSPDQVRFRLGGAAEWTGDQDLLLGTVGPVSVPAYGARLDQESNNPEPPMITLFRCARSTALPHATLERPVR